MNYNSLDLSILKTITTNKRCAIEFANECDTKLFNSDLWNFANVIVNYVRHYKDAPTLRTIQETVSKGNNKALLEYCNEVWKHLDTTTSNESEFKFDLEKIKDRYAEKQFSEIHTMLDGDAKGNIEKRFQEVNKKVQNIKSLKQKRAYERRTLKENIPVFRDEFNEKLNNPLFGSGILTGYSFLDEATGGLNPGEMLLIGGESGAGKSLLLMNVAIQMWLGENTIDMKENFKPGNDILYFSLEMPYKPCFNRVLSRLSGVESKRIKKPMNKDGKQNLKRDDKQKIRDALQFIKIFPNEFEIIDIPRGATVSQIESLYEEAKNHFNPKIIVIDYLGIMDDDEKQEDDWLKQGTISGKVHEFGRVHDLIVLSAVQLNRAKPAKDAEANVGMHRIGRSALIMTHANIGIQIESRKDEKSKPDMKYHLIKNRDGETGSGSLIKDLACGTLIDDPKVEKQIADDDDEIKYEFTDRDDISEKIDLLEI
jgi:replicative DNA helicase